MVADRGRGAGLGLLVRQIGYGWKAFWRVPVAAFFTFVFPLIFLVLFGAIFGDQKVSALGVKVDYIQFFTPAIAVFALATSCYTNLIISTSLDRDSGILKRVRGTPLPPWIYLAGRICVTVLVGFSSVVVMFIIGMLAYHVHVNWAGVPAAVVTLLVGAASFAALGMAVTGLVSNSETAPAVANFTMLPILFVSGVFWPIAVYPAWLQVIARIFPLAHFVDAFTAAVTPGSPKALWQWQDLAIMAAWAVFGVLVASRYFTWEPRAVSGGRGARRRRRAVA